MRTPFTPAFENAATVKEDGVIEFYCERVEYKTEEQLATESKGAKKAGRLGRLSWEFQMGDRLNRNRRIYPLAVCSMAMEIFGEQIKRDMVFGRVDHPDEWSPNSDRVTLSDAALKITEAKIDTKGVATVTCEILDNPFGQQLASVLAVKGNPGVSQRALARFREANDVERARFQIPDGEFVRVAEALRLITYDAVSDPGFADAQNPALEHKVTSGDQSMKTPAELQLAHPTLYTETVSIGRTLALSEAAGTVEKAIEAKKPEIIAAAVQPLTAQLTLKAAESAELKKALELVKPALVKLGIVNEQVTDAQAATRIATAEAKVTTLEAAVAAANETIKARDTEIAAFKNTEAAVTSLRLVAEQYKDHPHRNQILHQVAAGNIADPTKALEAAAGVANFIKTIMPAGTAPAAVAPAAPINTMASVLESLTRAPDKGSTSAQGGLSNEQRAVSNLLRAGVPSF